MPGSCGCVSASGLGGPLPGVHPISAGHAAGVRAPRDESGQREASCRACGWHREVRSGCPVWGGAGASGLQASGLGAGSLHVALLAQNALENLAFQVVNELFYQDEVIE